jgi:hypothetical protein
MNGRKPRIVATVEAYQEAGIKGLVGKEPIGAYYYSKSMPGGAERLCRVIVFLMRVTHEGPNWREQSQRTRAWFPRDTAASMVDEGSLSVMISDLLQERSGSRIKS